ncbi:hypothetical protein [Prevotella corporis]|nr:hypothetical protein [Prevotella corporis]
MKKEELLFTLRVAGNEIVHRLDRRTAGREFNKQVQIYLICS